MCIFLQSLVFRMGDREIASCLLQGTLFDTKLTTEMMSDDIQADLCPSEVFLLSGSLTTTLMLERRGRRRSVLRVFVLAALRGCSVLKCFTA